MPASLARLQLELDWRGHSFTLAAFVRPGRGPGFLYLPGLGCAKEDILAAGETPELAECALAGFDYPGHGDSPYPDGARLNLDDLAGLAAEVGDMLNLDRPVIIGHSLGGAVGLLYAEKYPARGFVNIEGNLRPENCSFSRESQRSDFKSYADERLPAYLNKLRQAGRPVLARYADDLARANPRAIYDLGGSLVDHCDAGDLLARYLQLALPTLYLYGEENRKLSYLPLLREAGRACVEISTSGHFPQQDNPAAVAAACAGLLKS